MTSLAKIASNRRNALKSTGPRTDEGKAQSRRNALRHGLAARTLVFAASEDEAEFAMFAADMMADLAPEGACEAALAQRIVLCTWRLERVARIEADILTGDARLAAAGTGLAPPAGIWPEEMVQIARYEATLDRALGRAMKLFHERQQARLAGRLPDAAEVTERSQVIAEIAERTQADPHPPAPIPLSLAGEGAERSEAGEGDAAVADPAKRSQIPAADAPLTLEIVAQRFERMKQIMADFHRAP